MHIHCDVFYMTRNSNLSGVQTEISEVNYVKIMAADALAPWIARTSAATVLNMHDNWILVIHKERFKLSVP